MMNILAKQYNVTRTYSQKCYLEGQFILLSSPYEHPWIILPQLIKKFAVDSKQSSCHYW